jgi:hypothetical protein
MKHYFQTFAYMYEQIKCAYLKNSCPDVKRLHSRMKSIQQGEGEFFPKTFILFFTWHIVSGYYQRVPFTQFPLSTHNNNVPKKTVLDRKLSHAPPANY